jgi:hypothetical protein
MTTNNPVPEYQGVPMGYNYAEMPYLEVVAHNPTHLKVSNNPKTYYRSVEQNRSPAVVLGTAMQRMPLIAAGYDTLTGENRCNLQNIDADYYSLKVAYEF